MTRDSYGPITRQLGANVREARKRRRLSLEDLAARVTQLGRPIGLNGLSKLELGNRGADLDDVVALARALDIPPIALIFPIRWGDSLEIAPNVLAGALPAAKWFAGDAAFPLAWS